MARTPTARERELVEEGAKGVAERWIEGGPGDGAVKGAQFRSAVRKVAGKPEKPPEREPDPETRNERRATRAQQAAAGMLPPSGSFDEAAIRDWLRKMEKEDLAKLSRLVSYARQGKDGERRAWKDLERSLHVEVHGGTVNIATGSSHTPYQPQSFQKSEKSERTGNDWSRYFSRVRDFING